MAEKESTPFSMDPNDSDVGPDLSFAPLGLPTFEQIEELIKDEVIDADPYVTDQEDPQLNVSSSWIVGTDKFYRIPIGNVRCLTFGVRNIGWQAGGGWPVYRTYCPRSDRERAMRFPNLLAHQIVPVFGGFPWGGCNNPAQACGNRVTPVFFGVNDRPRNYGDNSGTFIVDIYSHSS